MVFETNPLFQAGAAPVLPQLLGSGNGYDDAGSNIDDGDEDDGANDKIPSSRLSDSYTWS